MASISRRLPPVCRSSALALISIRAPYTRLQTLRHQSPSDPLLRPSIHDSSNHILDLSSQISRPFSTASIRYVSYRDLRAAKDDKPAEKAKAGGKAADDLKAEEGKAEKTESEAERIYKAQTAGAESERSRAREEDSAKTSSEEQPGKKEEKKTPPPPPPPHGDKSPWQVFRDTLQTEFKASKEWNESTKALAAGAQSFSENERIRKLREASGAAGSATGAALKGTGRAIGKGAAWTWDTTPVKGIRASASAAGRGVEKMTEPVRNTEVYKTISTTMGEGSSRYGGWTEKEERRRIREARELEELKSGRRPAQPMDEDPNAGTNVVTHKDSAWREGWNKYKEDSKLMQNLFTLKTNYNESENPLISTARAITDRIAGFFAENETAMVIKKMRQIDPSFQLEPWLREMREYILPEALDAYVKGDIAVLKQWLSAPQFQVYSALAEQWTKAGLKVDGKILDIRNVEVLSARLLDPGEVSTIQLHANPRNDSDRSL